jgi:hypothetical protein
VPEKSEGGFAGVACPAAKHTNPIRATWIITLPGPPTRLLPRCRDAQLHMLYMHS